MSLVSLSQEYQDRLQDGFNSNLTPKLVLKEFKREQAKALAKKLKTLDTEKEFLESIDKIKDIFTETKSSEKINLKQLAKNFFRSIENKTQKNYISTYSWLDFNKVVKPADEDIVIIAGRPGMGKTALALSLAIEYAENGKKGIIFSMEMGESQITNRIISQLSKIPLSKLLDGEILDEAMKDLSEACDVLYKLSENLSIVVGNASTDDILQELKTNKYDFVVVDYLQLLTSSMRLVDRVKEITQVSLELKRISTKFRTSIIALSQLSRNVESRADKRPMLSDLRESGQIEQDASIVLGVYREFCYNPNCQDKNLMEVSVIKNRNGALRNLKFNFLGWNQTITPTR